MTSLAYVPPAPTIPYVVAVARPASARRGQLRKWLGALLITTLLCPASLTVPSVWHGAVRMFLTWQASRSGYELTIERVTGGIFDVTRLEGTRLRQRDAGGETSGVSTDLTVANTQFVVAWKLPWSHRSASWLREIRLDGVNGNLDLTAEAISGGILQHHLNDAACRWLPMKFSFHADEFQIRRGACRLRVSDFVVSGKRDAGGEITAREVRVTGPGFASVFTGWRGQTFWKGDRLTFAGLDLGNGILLASTTLDASRLTRQRLEWDCRLTTTGSEIRGQGAVDFGRERIALEIAATLHLISLAPFARTLGIDGPVDGQVRQASLTFYGDPENLAAAQMSLSARATGCCWGNRRWESLDIQAVVVNRRVQIHRFDLRQPENRLVLSGEFPLPPVNVSAVVMSGEWSWGWDQGFSYSNDARIKDLPAFAKLAGPGITILRLENDRTVGQHCRVGEILPSDNPARRR